MEAIKILFFAISSFLGMENGQIIATTTIVNVSPQEKKIVIVQEDLCSIVRDSSSTRSVRAEWNEIQRQQNTTLQWDPVLSSFKNKELEINMDSNTISCTITLNYADKSQLRNLGIWFNKENNEFSINHIPNLSISSPQGKLDGNYWRFENQDFSFTINPFVKAPKNIIEQKKALIEIIE